MGVTPFGTASSATQWGIGPQIIVGSSTTIAKFVSSSHNVTSRVSFMAAPSSTFFARDSLRFNTGSCQTLHCRRGSRFIVGARKDYYAVLGVSKNSTKSEIETAYRKLARNYHLGVKRKDISNAYEILSNDEKRSIYDSYEVLLDDEERSLYDRYDTYEVLSNEEKQSIYEKYEEAGLKGQGIEDEECKEYEEDDEEYEENDE